MIKHTELVDTKEWRKQPVFPKASYGRRKTDIQPGTMEGYSPQLSKKYKELTTSSQRMDHGEFVTTHAADKKRKAGDKKRKPSKS